MSMTRYVAVSAIVVVCGAVVAVRGATLQKRQVGARRHSIHEALNRDALDKQRAAFRIGGLRAAAKITGSVTRRIDIGVANGPRSFGELVRVSDFVFAGIPATNECKLSADGKSINLLYRVKVQYLVKGDPIPNGEVTVIVPGGMVTFEDGTSAEVVTPGFSRPVNGRNYMWFIQLDHGRENPSLLGDIYRPTFGPLGIYLLDVSPGATVRPSGGFQSQFARRVATSALSPQDFAFKVWEASTGR